MSDDVAAGFSEVALCGIDDLERRLASHHEVRAVGQSEAAPERPSRQAPTNQIHQWSHRERLRSRFRAGGHAPMPEDEILEMLLFNAIRHSDVTPLVKRLLARFGSLDGVMAASEARLLAVEGVTPWVIHHVRLAEAIAHRVARARVLEREVIGSWDALITYCTTIMAHRETEAFRVLFLDRKNILVADEEQGRGTVDHVPVYPREVAKRALELNASAVVLVHNHPSGDPTPSREDVEVTRLIEAACRTIGVTIHDHVVIGKGETASLRELGLF